ncbi:MAG: ComEC/Rec2 family competence protein, partial [Ruminiclostridium sp.]|nr:ComEC/Rec2 family competence protein [Ruminiclostridium sp.]
HNRFAVIGISLFVCFFVSSLIGSAFSFIISAALTASAAAAGFAAKKQAAAFALTACAAAFLIYAAYSAAFIEPISALRNRTLEIGGTVISSGRPGGGSAYITAACTADGLPVKLSFYAPDTDITPGSTVTAEVTFTEMPRTASYTDSYNYSRGIFLRASAENAVFTENGGFSLPAALAAYSEELRASVSAELDEPESGLLRAVFFGDKSGLTDSLSAQIRRCGLSHFTAVSGMHLSLIVIVIMTALGALPFGKKRAVRFAAVLALTAVFMLFFNMTASVRRSGLMLIFFYGSELFRRERSTLNSLGAALTLILLAEPYACRDTGLLLSACGTFGAGVVSPALCELIEKRRKISSAAKAVLTCVCASYCTIPVSAAAFGGFSVLSPITSPVILPFFTAALIFTLAFALTGGFSGFLLIPAGAALRPVIAMIKAMSAFEYAYIVPDSELFPAFAAVSGLFIAAVLLLVRYRGMGKRFVVYSVTVVLCALIGIETAGRLTGSGTARIAVCSDGSGFVAAVSRGSGVSLFASKISPGLSGKAYDIFAESCTNTFDLICALSPGERSDAYSEAFSRLPAAKRVIAEKTGCTCDIGGAYSAEIHEDSVTLRINGISVIMTDISSAADCGGHDIGIYGGLRSSESYDINGVTVLSDKRYREYPGAYNAYYRNIEIRIAPDGRVRVISR